MADAGHTSLPASCACCLYPCKSEHFWSWFRFAPLRLKTAAAFGSIDYALRLDFRFFPTPLLRHGVGRGVRTSGHKLSSHFHSHFTPDTVGMAGGVGFVPIPVCPETSACYSDSQGQASALRPPVGALPPFAAGLPPDRGLMNARIIARGTRFISRRRQ